MPKSPAVLPFLIACLAVAGCDRGRSGSAEPTAQPTAASAEAVLGARWRQMFADPQAVISAANDFGYKAGPWQATSASAYRSRGIEQVLPDARSPVRVHTRFAAQGSARAVDAIEFRFDIAKLAPPDTKKARDAVNIPRRIVAGFLSRFGLGPGDEIRRALMNATSATTAQHGGHIIVDNQPLATGNGRAIRVTVTRN